MYAAGEPQPNLHQPGDDCERAAQDMRQKTGTARPIIVRVRSGRVMGEVVGLVAQEPEQSRRKDGQDDDQGPMRVASAGWGNGGVQEIFLLRGR